MLKIPQDENQNDLTIIYKEEGSNIFELKTSKDDLLHNLHFFKNMRYEIDKMNLIYIQEDIKFDIFRNFILSIKTKEIPINENNFQYYHYLSTKYGYDLLTKEINKFASSRPDICSTIDQLLNNEEEEEIIDSHKEEILSKNLDIVLNYENFKNSI